MVHADSVSTGPANITIVNPSGASGSLSGGFLYTSIPPSTQPTLNVVVPNTGSPKGGTAIAISGSNFVSGLTVTVGGSPATITSRGTNSIQATTPGGNAGTAADIVVTNPNGQSATLKAAFSYANPPASPVLNSISPASGSSNGGTQVVITWHKLPVRGNSDGGRPRGDDCEPRQPVLRSLPWRQQILPEPLP